MKLRITVETVFENGRTVKHRLGTWRRSAEQLHPEGIGLLMEDGHTMLSQIQKVAIEAQMEEISVTCRACPCCGKVRPIHDYRTRSLETLFGRLKVKAPRIKPCRCQVALNPKSSPLSPLSHLLPDRATPEMTRLQVELGARHSFREAARLMEQLLACARQCHMTVRGRMARVADDMERRTLQPIEVPPPTGKQDHAVSVFLDGAHIRCRPEYKKRHLDVVVGRIESAKKKGRFAFESSSSLSPRALIRARLQSAGWQPGQNITVFTEGEPGLVDHVRSATGRPVTHILDWWHISMRIKHIENAAAGLQERCAGRKGADKLPWLAKRLRWLIWHGQTTKALVGLRHLRWRAESLQDLTRPLVGLAIQRIRKRGEFLATYLENNAGSIADYGKRHRDGHPVSTSRAEGCVDDLANLRMGKRRRMRWSPKGAHRVAITRAAVLDGRLNVSHRPKAA
ncbi:MAG: ISKra4 family transposase [Roseovarius sp.]